MDIDEEGKEITRDEDGESALEAEGKKDDGLEDRLCSLSRQGQANQPQKPRKRKVSFPEDECLVTKSVDPVDPWANASNASSSDVVKAYMNSCARLRIKPIDKVVKQLREHTIFHSRVDILDLKGLKLDVKSCEALEEVFKRVQVYTLDIENTNLEDEGAIALVEMIEFYQSATHISIGYNPRIKTRGWQVFSQMVRKAPFVEFIDMRHCCFNDPCIALLARSLKLNSTLRILHLEGDNLSGKLLIILCTGLKMNHTLAELFLGDNFLIPSDAGTLSAMLKSNCTLQLLDIRNNMLQDQGLMHLCDGLHQQNMGGIKTLVLWNNQISRSGMVPLSNLMAVTKNIQTLNIGHNRLGNDGIHTLQIGLLKNRSLLRLGLLNTKITAEGAVALAEYIADTRTLLRLDLRENDLFVGGLMALTLAVKINETVVRIDLDKDLKKEQGMEGTQTSLLVDIYQYLERNKKLGIKREEMRKKEKQLEQQKLAELEKEKEREKGKENQAKTEKDSAEAVEVSEMTDGNRDTLQGPNDNPQNQGLENSVAEDSGGDEGNSRFTVSLVNDLEHENTKNSLNEPFVDIRTFEKGLVFEEVKDEANATESESLERINNHRMPESSKLAEQSTSEEDACSPEEFDEELDQLLANVSGVQIDYTDLPSPHDEDFWNKDMQEMLKSSAN